MKILELAVENVKRIRAVEIKSPGDVVVIAGENEQGKSSLFDGIEWLFAGAKHMQSVPIRKGEKSARMMAKIGDKEVEFVFTRNLRDGKRPELIVTTGAGFTPPGGAQGVADAFFGALSFDPLAFSRMNEKELFAELLRVFPVGVDLDELNGLNRTDYARRTKVNGDAKAARIKAASIIVAPDLPPEPIDESKLLDRITDAADGNAQIEQRKAKRVDTAREISNALERAKRDHAKAAEIRRQMETQIAELLSAAKEADQTAVALQDKLNNAPPLPEPTDIAALRAELDAAKATNAALAAREARAMLEADALDLETESKALTEAMEAREQAKRDALAAVKLPVDGLTFGDGIVMFNGVPFDQAGASKSLVVSVAIAMAANPKLKLILVRDASLLDKKSRAQIEAMARKGDYQVWYEITGTNEPAAFIIEDGSIISEPDGAVKK